jgi:hypothetical protein
MSEERSGITIPKIRHCLLNFEVGAERNENR